jgi:N6-L-threonylcarbamoyladenine synthase
VGIESSCDESAVALFDGRSGVVFEQVASQIAVHGEYGGVVPELASREHVRNFTALFENLKRFGISGVELVAVTNEPGLPGCVAVGIAAARALALLLDVPIVGINHLLGHIFSPFIELHAANGDDFPGAMCKYLPHLGLLVSGGNTLLVVISRNGNSGALEIFTVAETQDDAAGEAFDKGARLLGLPYPGGMHVEKLAQLGDGKKFRFPRAFSNRSDLKFSFSGLKTSLKYFLSDMGEENIHRSINDICASYQEAIIGALAAKISQAMALFPDISSIGLSGGVSNNESLRSRVESLAESSGKRHFFPLRRHSGDNAAMVAFAAHIGRSIGCEWVKK